MKRITTTCQYIDKVQLKTDTLSSSRKILLLILLVFALSNAKAQYSSKIVHYPSVYTTDVIVRNFDENREFVFVHHEDRNVLYYGQDYPHPYKTTIYERALTTNSMTKVAELPNGYRAFDVHFVRFTGANGRVYDFCVFCGTRLEQLNSLIPPGYYIESTGFVGYMYVDESPTGSSASNVYIRDIEGTGGLTKMAAYRQTGGPGLSICNNYIYNNQNIAVDAIGFPKNNVGRSSCMTRVRIYPECNGTSRWESTLLVPDQGSTEKLVDIVATADSIVTVSTFNNDTSTIWLRQNVKDTTNICTIHPLSSTIYSLNLNTIGNPHPIYFRTPVRICHLAGNEIALSFVASNVTSTTSQGLFSYPIRLGATPRISTGVNIPVIDSLFDVCRYPDTLASASLTKDTNGKYTIPTVRWQSLPLVYALKYNSSHLQSIDGYRRQWYSISRQFIHVGGYYTSNGNHLLKLMEHIYPQTPPYIDCFINIDLTPIYKTISYTIHDNYNFTKITPVVIPPSVITILKSSGSVNHSNICDY